MKKVVSIFLALLMVVTMFPLSAFAEDNDNVETTTNQDVSYSASNSLGDVISDAMNKTETEKEFNNNCYIQSVEISGLSANVVLSAQDESTAVVAIYDEESNIMVTSGKADVDSTTESVTIELAECEMPEYFVIKAFLLNSENEPLCTNYENRENTKAFIEFFEKTVFDFDEEKVINLDYSYETNFAVVADDAKVLEQSENENILTTNDFDNGIYVFENANKDITSLKENDVLYFVYGDGADDYILTKVGTIKNNNGTVTITTAEEYEISDFFSYIKIDSTQQQTEQPQTFAMARGFDDDSGDEEKTNRYDIEFFSIQFRNSDKKDPDKSVVVDKGIDYDITLSLKRSYIENYVKFYYDIRLLGKDAYEFEYSIKTSINLNFELDIYGQIAVTFYILKDKSIPVLPALDIAITMKLTISFSAHVTATGYLGFETSKGVQRHYDKRKHIDYTNQLNPETKPFIEFDGQINIQINVTPVIEAGFKILKVFSAAIGVEGKIAFVLTLAELDINSMDKLYDKCHCCDLCFNVETQIGIKVYFKIGFNITKDPEKEKIIVQINPVNISVTPIQWYLSLYDGDWEFKKGECENYLYKIEFYVVNEIKQPYSGILISSKTDTIITDENGIAVMYMRQGSQKVTASTPNGKDVVTEEFIVKKESQRITIEIFRCKVVVFVRDAFGNPLPDVTVYNDWTTNEDGQAEFYLTGGIYNIKAVTKEGFEASKQVFIVDKPLETVELIISECKVFVRIFDDEGKPMQGAVIDGKYSTDANGETVAYLKTGTNTVSVLTPEGATVLKEATVDKSEQIIEFTISKCKVIVTVVDENDNPLSGILVNNTYVTDRNGKTEFKVTEGIHSVFVRTENGEELLQSIVVSDHKEISVTFTIDTGTQNVIAEGQCGDDAYWKLRDNGELYIYGTGDMWDFECQTAPYESCKTPWYPYWKQIYSVVILDGVTNIGRGAFFNISWIKNVSIPDSVTSIGELAFYGCQIIKSINIPENITSIEKMAFYLCESLDSISLPDHGIYIGYCAFVGTKYYRNNQNWENGILYIGKHLINAKTEITDCSIKEDTLNLAYGAFMNCSNIKRISIPNKITSISHCAFSGCTSLTSVTIPDSVTVINDDAFHRCTSLTSVTIPDSVTVINEHAFSDCESLTSITIPNSVTSIGNSAFSGCKSLTSITLPEKGVSLGISVFYNTEYCNNSENWIDGFLYIGNHLYLVNSEANNITVKNGTVSIAADAFSSLYTLESVSLPDSLIYIGDYAFAYCVNLKNVKLPGSVSEIGCSTFQGCDELESITIPQSVEIIGDYAFQECRKLKSVILSNSLTGIGDYAFQYCTNLESLILPGSLTRIGDYAFQYCNKLDTVYYAGTQEEWNKISVGVSNYIDYESIIFNYFYTDAVEVMYMVPNSVALNVNCISETLTNAVIGNDYIMLVVKDENAEDLLASENLLFIDQQKAASEELTFSFNLDDSVTDYSVLFCNAYLGTIEETHTHDYTAVATAPACSEQGFTTFTCICGDSYVDNYVDATGHTPGDWEIITPAQVGIEGFEQLKCDDCGEVLDEKIIPAFEDTEPALLGDVNGDGGITASDARLALRFSAELDIPTEEQIKLSDANEDGFITASDARKILRISAELE